MEQMEFVAPYIGDTLGRFIFYRSSEDPARNVYIRANSIKEAMTFWDRNLESIGWEDDEQYECTWEILLICKV